MISPTTASHPHDGEHHHPHLPALLDRRAALHTGAIGLGAVLLAACGSNGTAATGSTPTTHSRKTYTR